MKNIIKYECPHCKQEFEITVYPVINLQEDKEIYEKLFTLDLFRFTCEHCKKNILVQYDTFVVDMYKKYMIYLCTSQNVYTINKEQLFNSLNNLPEFKTALSNLVYTRIVSNLNELLEKLLIFDYDLNDKVIELLKLSLFEKQCVDQMKYPTICFNKIERETIIFTCFNFDNSEIQPIDISVDIKYYNTCIDNFGSIPADTGVFECIDKNWLKNIKENNNDRT